MRPNGDFPPRMKGATGSVAGRRGLVPKPAATDNVKYLKGDGSWSALSNASAATNAEAAAGTSSSVFLTPATAAIATATTRNALAPAQALSGNGTAGSTLNVPALGTKFSLAFRLNPTSLPAYSTILHGAAVGSFYLYYNAAGTLTVQKSGVGGITVAAGEIQLRDSVYCLTADGTTLTLYRNGISVASAACSYDFIGATTALGATASNAEVVNGTIRLIGIWNYALSQAQVTQLNQQNAVDSADINSASNTATYTSNFSAGTDSWGTDSSRAVTGNVDSINGSNDWLKTEVTSGPASLYSYTAASFTANVKKRLRIAVTIFNPTGSGITHFAIRQNDGTVASGSSVVVALAENTEVTTSVELLLSQASTSLGVAACGSDGTLNAIAAGKIFYIKNFTVYNLGLLVAPDWAGYTGGPQVIDVSGNGADTNLPGDGVTGGVVPTLPGATPSPFRATRTSSGYVIGDQVVIPPGSSVSIWAKGNGTFSLGDSPGTPASVVNAQTAPTNLSPITQAGYVTATRKLYLTLGTATSVTVRVVFNAV